MLTLSVARREIRTSGSSKCSCAEDAGTNIEDTRFRDVHTHTHTRTDKQTLNCASP